MAEQIQSVIVDLAAGWKADFWAGLVDWVWFIADPVAQELSDCRFSGHGNVVIPDLSVGIGGIADLACGRALLIAEAILGTDAP